MIRELTEGKAEEERAGNRKEKGGFLSGFKQGFLR
jgi:hypothetical protein